MKPIIHAASLSVEGFHIRQRSEYLCMTQAVFAVQLDYSLHLWCSKPNIVVVGTWLCSCLADVLICFASCSLNTCVSTFHRVVYLTSVEPRTRPSGDFSQLRKCFLLLFYCLCSYSVLQCLCQDVWPLFKGSKVSTCVSMCVLAVRKMPSFPSTLCVLDIMEYSVRLMKRVLCVMVDFMPFWWNFKFSSEPDLDLI